MVDRSHNGQRMKRVAVLWILALAILLIGAGLYNGYRAIVGSPVIRFGQYVILLHCPQTAKTALLVKTYGLQNQETTLDIVDIAGDTKIVASRGFGEYRLDKIYALGQLSEKGSLLLGESLSEHYQLPVVGVVTNSTSCPLGDSPIERNVLDAFLFTGEWYSFSGNQNSDKTAFKLVLRGLKTDKIFPTTNVDKAILNDTAIVRDNLSVEVVNLSDRNGLAERFAKFLGVSGVRVVRTLGEIKPNTTFCTIYVHKDLQASYTVRWLEYFRRCKFGGVMSEGGRADVRVEVGEDYWQMLEEKW